MLTIKEAKRCILSYRITDAYVKSCGIVGKLNNKACGRGVTKRCRLSWLTNIPLIYELKCPGRGELRGLIHMLVSIFCMTDETKSVLLLSKDGYHFEQEHLHPSCLSATTTCGPLICQIFSFFFLFRGSGEQLSTRWFNSSFHQDLDDKSIRLRQYTCMALDERSWLILHGHGLNSLQGIFLTGGVLVQNDDGSGTQITQISLKMNEFGILWNLKMRRSAYYFSPPEAVAGNRLSRTFATQENLFYVYCTVNLYTYCNVQYIHAKHTLTKKSKQSVRMFSAW